MRVVVIGSRVGAVHLRLARQVCWQAAIHCLVVRRLVARWRHCGGRHLLHADSIQYFALQKAALRARRALGEAFAGAAEDHPVAPGDLQLQLVHQQAQHHDLRIARLHHQAQRLGAIGLVCGVIGVVRHDFTVPSA